jgi:hypothetical protein
MAFHRTPSDASRGKRMLAAAAALLCALLLGPVQPDHLVAFTDGDGDGIDDGDEAALAERFLPEMRYDFEEHCPLPLPSPIIFRLRHPTYQGVPYNDYIAINYEHLYLNDCGPAGHGGDNEGFLVFLRWNGSDWAFDSVSATAHAGTSCQVATASYTPLLWIGRDKHGTFADLGQCQSGTFCNNVCSWNGGTDAHLLYNVGEPNGWLINDLGQVHPTFGGQTVWNDDQFFAAGKISDQLYLSGYYHLTRPPDAYDSCIAECNANYDACVANGGVPEDCGHEADQCRSNCIWLADWDR